MYYYGFDLPEDSKSIKKRKKQNSIRIKIDILKLLSKHAGIFISGFCIANLKDLQKTKQE